MLGRLLGEIEGIGILHQKFAAAHDAEARPALVAELPLNVVEIARQVAIALRVILEEVGDHFFIGWAEQHLPLIAILDA